MDTEKLKADKEKLLKQIEQAQVALIRMQGAIAYINDCIKELEKPKE
jgi:hypothetical protein